MTQLSKSSQDYLKTIYKLTTQQERVSTSQLADYLNLKPASVTNMVQKLAQAEPPLVDYQKHHGVALTPDGERSALEMVRHHRLLELFLHEVLGFSWDEVHEEAERLEHCISEKMERRIAELLNHPRLDPHGEPIPNHNLEIVLPHDLPLSQLRRGDQAIIRRVDDHDDALLRYLDEIGLRLDVSLQVVNCVSFDRTMQLQIAGMDQPLVVGARITDHIFVEIITN
ncbi:MAG: metal-dependent transcriptional regulator [Anaerolinea sp.]|nr:metal-dependent transcriptional regulator [Anaerolinea sp.]